MMIFSTMVAICCLAAAKASPSHWASSSNQQLEAVPDLETYAKISYPKYDILDLGEYSHDHVPGDQIKITKESKITIPQPYPVKVPVPQPYPVHIEKPYPVHETKIVKVPYPVPQVIEKKVPYPVEVLKPYPVQGHSSEGQIEAQSKGYGGDIGGHQGYEGNGYGVEESHGNLPSNEGYDAGFGGGDAGEAKSLEGANAESVGWQPLGGEEGH